METLHFIIDIIMSMHLMHDVYRAEYLLYIVIKCFVSLHIGMRLGKVEYRLNARFYFSVKYLHYFTVPPHSYMKFFQIRTINKSLLRMNCIHYLMIEINYLSSILYFCKILISYIHLSPVYIDI